MSAPARTRLKFSVTHVADHEDGGRSVELQAVMDGSEENKQFWKYTPAGSLTFSVSGEVQSAQYFELGQSYYIDLTPAD